MATPACIAPVESAGIVANCQREAAVACAGEMRGWLRQRGRRVLLSHDLAEALGVPDEGVGETELGRASFVIALGGDGTLIAANRIASPHGTPILGIHVGGPGSFGFLTETTPAHACDALDSVLDGRCHVDERLMVSAEVRRQGRTVAQMSGLNDLVVRAQARMLRMRIAVGETYIATYAADGIIVATPTGSTAYNLAAGGPLVHPSVETILLTPICPHTLNVRTLLVGVHEVIHADLETGHRDTTLLTVDGQVGFQLEPGDRIGFCRSDRRGRFIALDGANFYQKVQTRLRLGERFGSG